MKKIYLVLSILILSLFSIHTLFAKKVSASHKTGKYTYLVGTGVICGLDPSACPDISMSEDGETIEMTGEGVIDRDAHSVTGGGTFVHKDKDGNVIGSGDWHAMKLVSFRSWGPQDDLPSNFEGGRAKLKVHLAPSGGGPGFSATLRIICAVGDFPESAHDQEGFELSIWRGPNFVDQVSGFTLFIKQ